MGIFTSLLAAAEAFDASLPRAGISLHVTQELKAWAAKGDPELSDIGAPFEAVNQVQTMAVYTDTVSSGNYTLTFTLASGETFTTGNILYNANAATVQGAINTAATNASIVGWTNDDIVVAGGTLDSAPFTFTFSGDSVSGQNHALIVATDVDLSADELGEITITTAGQTDRLAYACLYKMGLITAAVPDQGTEATVTGTGVTPHTYQAYPHPDTIRALAYQAEIDDNQANPGVVDIDIATTILAAIGVESVNP